MHKVLVLLILVLLAACTAEPPVTDVPFYTATARPLSEIPTRNPYFLGTSIPLDFAGGEPQVLQSVGRFNFAISGALIAQANTGTVVYSQLPRTGALPAREQLYLAASDANSTQQIRFEFSPDLPIGQYPLVAAEDFILGVVSAQYQRLVATDDGVALENYGQEVKGTLELTAVGESISGSFQFGAAYIQSSDTGEVQSQYVEITGEFESVPFYVAGADPFEIIVPLPTRIFDGTAVPISTGQP